ncbi:response regulator transcription factor [Sulfurospirillum arcachonense]|uniref:response regulator transcription factor n=1 Tax=Sulfurospirillum arcachonense TaxID=57666 RepID=UPI000468B82A|nr:response regulator transcription factor [Sulfurospirillum arcachonense]
MINILMIEDDLELAEILTEYLEQYEINVTTAEDPFIGLSTLSMSNFDLIILDLTLPGIDGLEVCKEIRKKYSTPIIISSARHDITDKVTALDNGADDYLPKPYNPRELQARIKSLLRRHTQSDNVQKQEDKKQDLILNESSMSIQFLGNELTLTSAEYGILSYLIKKDGGVVSREELIYNIDSINEDTTNKSIDVIIGRIRHKLNENPKEPKYIQSVRGIGYKFLK